MPSIDNEAKLKLFEATIMEDVSNKLKIQNSDLQEYKNEYTDRIKKEITDEIYETLKWQKGEYVKKLAKSASEFELTQKKELFEFRAECEENVFSAVREHLQKFVAGGDYVAHLEKLLSDNSGAISKDVTVFLREKDLKLKDSIKALKGIEVLPDSTIKIGGLKIKTSDGRGLVDLSLDNKLADQKEWFRENSGC